MKTPLKRLASLMGAAGISAVLSLPALAQTSPSPNSPSPSPGSGVIEQPADSMAPGSMMNEPSSTETLPQMDMSVPGSSQTPSMTMPGTMPGMMTQPSAAMPMMTEEMTIGAIVEESPSFELLNALVRVAALEDPQLVDNLKSGGDYTVFAPTDEAFAALPPGAITALVQPENRQLLVDLLSYHIVPGRVASTEVASADFDADLTASSLVPPSGELNPNANVGAVDRTNVIDPQDNADMSSPGGSPTADSQEPQSSLVPPPGELNPNANVGAVDRTNVIDPQGSDSASMSSPSISTDYTTGRVTISGARVVGADIEAQNGIIHAIDRVIIPTELQSSVAEALSAGTVR